MIAFGSIHPNAPRTVVAGVALTLAVASAPLSAEEKPVWEAGLGVGGIVSPSYRGAKDFSAYALPLPYIIYRGTFLKADRDGVRGTFFETSQVKINTSLTASLPVKSDASETRNGMPDLDPTVELGPSLDITLWRSPDRRLKLDLGLPARMGLTVSGSPEAIGWLFSPRLNLDIGDIGGVAGLNLGLLAGPLFGTRGYHDYFYSVDPQYATETRPSYEARGGYGGFQFLAAVSKRFSRHWVGCFIRYDTLQGAVFQNSPLVETDHYLAAGVAVAWILGESSRYVNVDE